MQPKLWIFKAVNGSDESTIKVIATTSSQAWAAAVEKGSRRGPFALRSIEFIEQESLPKQLERFVIDNEI